MTEVYVVPDWVIVGTVARQPGYPEIRVMVVASQKLTRAELVRRIEVVGLTGWPLGRQDQVDLPPVWDLTMVLGDVYMAYGATYAEALQRLFAAWSPDVREAVAAPPRKLNAWNSWPEPVDSSEPW